jgi:hypothetical protein
MQLDTNVGQLDSREYKLILDASQLTGTDKDRDEIMSVLEGQIDKQKITLKKPEEKKVKTVWYLDTDSHELYRNNNFTIRSKVKPGENKKYDVTFKARHKDKNLVKSYDLQNINQQPSYKIEEQKFEEDIILQSDSKLSMASKFSTSTELEYKDYPDLKTWNDVLSIFPKLKFPNPKLDVSKDTPLTIVNGLQFEETNYKSGEILFDGVKKAEVGFSVWLSKNDNKLVIGEFDMDVNVRDLVNNDKSVDDVFNDPVISEIDKLYKKMQMHYPSIIDKTNTTKTEYVYNYKKID